MIEIRERGGDGVLTFANRQLTVRSGDQSATIQLAPNQLRELGMALIAWANTVDADMRTMFEDSEPEGENPLIRPQGGKPGL